MYAILCCKEIIFSNVFDMPVICKTYIHFKLVFVFQNDLPKLNIDLEKLFRIGGDRANGSHLHCSDIKNLLLYTVLGPGKWDRPTWCNTSSWDKVKQTLFVMVGNVGGEEYITYKECFKNIDKHFTQVSISAHTI